jgi:hypothetical protein
MEDGNEWFTDPDSEFQIARLEPDSQSHVTILYAKEIDGEWEYAIVEWRYKRPTLVLRFKSGQVLETGLSSI